METKHSYKSILKVKSIKKDSLYDNQKIVLILLNTYHVIINKQTPNNIILNSTIHKSIYSGCNHYYFDI